MDKNSGGAVAGTGTDERNRGTDTGRNVALLKKKTDKLWLWRAYAPVARRTIAWVLGGRHDATCRRLISKIGGIKGQTFITDDWPGYARIIPEDQLFTGKDLTFSIEQDNSNIRHYLARFRRRTKVVSHSAVMVDLSLRLYHYLHDTAAGFRAYQKIFMSIFP